MNDEINTSEGQILEVLNNKVDMDFQNVPSNSVSFARCSREITNCITEIPQRIKLELNNGTLTLKAGSIVTVPNGFEADGTTPKFDYVTVDSDTDMPNGSATAGQRMCWLTLPSGHGNGIARYCFSGNTSVMNSTTPNTYSTFYNTETNKMYRGNGTAWEEKLYSLPFCLATNDTTTAYTSIDQVFNGMGYMGSTLWVDKGVKGLIPNGRNEDGTLKNLEFTIDSVKTQTTTNTAGKTWGWYFNSDGSFNDFSIGIYKTSIKKLSDRPTTWTGGYCIYVEDENRNYVNQYTNPSMVIMVADVVIDSASITSLTPKTTFRAVDYNEFKIDLDTKANIDIVPVGTVISSANSSTPSGYLYCNGAAVSRTTYASLFSAIGTTYGTGDGSTTFNLPSYSNYQFVTSGTVSVKGNGKSLGLSDGSKNLGLGSFIGSTQVALSATVNSYGKNVGSSVTDWNSGGNNVSVGVTTNATNSGLTGTVSTATLKWYIKY